MSWKLCLSVTSICDQYCRRKLILQVYADTFCRWIIWVLDINLLILWKVLIFYQSKFVSKRGAKRWTCGRQQRTWSENVTSRFCNHSSVIHCHYACKMCCNYAGTKLEPALQKSNICHHILTSSTQLQNRSFHVVERTRTSAKCLKIKNARAKRAKLLFVIVKYANLWRSCCRPLRGFLSCPYLYLLENIITPSSNWGQVSHSDLQISITTVSWPLHHRDI